jgi:hypothetical protein
LGLCTSPSHNSNAGVNADAKRPSTAVALDLNPEKTPSRRFLTALRKGSKVFSREEIETRLHTIGSKSRKLTTNATIEGAIRPMTSELAELEKKPNIYKDLIAFVVAFFDEIVTHYRAWRPGASNEERKKLRKESFAISNIMFHPLLRMAYDLWCGYRDSGIDWRRDTAWKDAITKITGSTSAKDPDSGRTWTGEVFDRNNPQRKCRIVIKNLDSDGNEQWSLSSTRQTRESAYEYLREVAGLPVRTGSGRKSRKAA